MAGQWVGEGGLAVSTYMYLECQDHDPPLLSYDEVGQHRYDLPRIWDQIRGCDQVLADGEDSDYFAYNARRFLAQHRDCRITVRDEYGEEHPESENACSGCGSPRVKCDTGPGIKCCPECRHREVAP